MKRMAQPPARLLDRPISVIGILEYVLMLFVLLYSSIWSLFTSAGCNTFLRLGIPLLLALIGLRVCRQPIPAMRWKRTILLTAFLAAFAVATGFFNGIRYVLYYMIPLVLLALYIGLTDERDGCLSLMLKLSDIVVVLSCISLFFFVLGTCLHILPGRQLVSYYWAEQNRTCGTYFHLYYESQSIHFLGHDFVRNCGLFTEAPGFAVFLVYAFSVEVLLRPRMQVWRCLLLGVTALSTFSAKAILLTVLAAALRFLITRSPSVTVRRMKLILVPCAAVAVALVGIVLIRDKMTSASFYLRMDDLFACLRTWLTRPLFGTGYWNDESVIPFFTYAGRNNNGLSMGIAVLLAEGGIYLTALYFVPFIGCILRARGFARRRMGAFFIVYAGLLFITNMPYSFLTLFLLAISLEMFRPSGQPKPVSADPAMPSSPVPSPAGGK